MPDDQNRSDKDLEEKMQFTGVKKAAGSSAMGSGGKSYNIVPIEPPIEGDEALADELLQGITQSDLNPEYSGRSPIALRVPEAREETGGEFTELPRREIFEPSDDLLTGSMQERRGDFKKSQGVAYTQALIASIREIVLANKADLPKGWRRDPDLVDAVVSFALTSGLTYSENEIVEIIGDGNINLD